MMIAVARKRIRGPSLWAAAVAAMRSFSVAPMGGEDKRLYRRLSALGAQPGGSVAAVIDGWVKEGKAVTESKLVNIVKELRKYKNYKHALRVIDWMEKRGFNISASIHAMRLDLISKFKSVDVAEKYFASLQEPAKNQLTYGALFNAYCQEKREVMALSLYEKMKELNLASTTLVKNNIMTLHLKLGQHDKVKAHFQEMKAAKISPDRITYGILMSSYASQNDINSIERFLEEMKTGGKVSLEWNLCCNLAGCYNSAGLFEKAESTLKKAEKLMSPGDRDAYHFLITLYAGAGNLEEVKRVWRLLRASFGKTTNMSYYNMFHALRKLEDLDGLKQCFEEWKSHNESYDIKLVNVVIDAYLKKSMADDAEKVWEEAISKGSGSDVRILELFANYYLERHEMDLATKFLDRFAGIARKEKWKPDRRKAKKFLQHLMEVKDVDGVGEFSKKVKNLVFFSLNEKRTTTVPHSATGH